MIARMAVGVAVVMALAGCTDDAASPTTLTPATPSPTASATPTELPTPPPEANAHTPDGAAAFVRFYIELINSAYETGASEPLREYATNECNSCTSIASAVDDIYADGGRAIGGLLTINNLTATGVAEGVQTSVIADTSATALTTVDSTGKVLITHRAEAKPLIFDLAQMDRGWLVGGIRESEEPT